MSQKIPADGAHKGFAVGRGLLAAAETLNFSSSRPNYGMSSSLGSGEGKSHSSQLPQRGSGHVSNTMKLFDSLGLSPTDIDALAQIPEENISIETLPQLIMQVKNRKLEASRRMGDGSRDMAPLSPERSYRASRGDWEAVPTGRMGSSGGQASARGQQMDYGYGSMQEGPTHGYKRMEYGENSGGGLSRDRQYSELSRDRYGGLGMGPSLASDSGFLQKRMGSPSQGKVQDFLGAMPHMFPHVCSLCDFDVHSTMEWTQHTNGLRHAENRRQLLQMYPEWDPHMDIPSGSIGFDTTNRSDGILGPAPVGLPRGGMTSTWGSSMSSQKQPLLSTPKMGTRVIVAENEGKPIILTKLLSLAQPFGTVVQHLVRLNKAYLEMQSHEEAVAMVNFYKQKPPVMHGKQISIYLCWERFPFEKGSQDGSGRQSQVVFFSNLPKEREKKSELLTIARRFGTVDKYLFLSDQAFVQLGTPEDAEMLVKYYTLHPLTIKGRSIRLNICTKYKTLIVNSTRHGTWREREDRKPTSTSRKGSPKKQRSGSTSERSSKGKEESSRKEEELEAEDSAGLEEEGSGDEVTGVMEAEETEEGVGGEGGDVQEAGQTEAVEEEEEPSSLAEQAVPESDLTEHTEEASEVPPTEGSKGAAAEEPPAQTETSQTEGEIPPEETKGAEPSAEPAESSEIPNEELEDDQEELMEQDLPENMEDFVTLDELAEEEDADGAATQSGSDSQSESSKKAGGRKVVRVVGFRRRHNCLDEILTLAKPFGKVVRYLVLDTRREAFLELASEEEAKAMVAFYNSNVTPTVCGKPVKIYHSQAHATMHNGKVVYVGQIPVAKTSDAAILKMAEPFGKVRCYFLNRPRNECFIEMESGEDAERMANTYSEHPPKLHGQQLTVYLSRKYKQLRNARRPPPPEPEQDRPSKRERSGAEEDSRSAPPAKIKVKKEEEPPAKKTCIREEKSSPEESSSSREEQKAAEEEPSSNGVNQLQQDEMEKGSTEPPSGQEELVLKTENEEVKITKPSESEDTQKKGTEGGCGSEGAVVPPCSAASEKSSESEETPNAKPQAEKKPPSTPVPLGPYQPNNPVGVEFVKMGYYCRVCFLFYSNEETAKKVHCSSLSHYQKLQKHLEKEKEKAKAKTKSL